MPIRDFLRQSPLYRPYVALKYRLRSDAREELFTGFYRENIWGDAESRSGSGSNLAQTERLRVELAALLRELGVTSLLDVPCGDFTWMQHVDLCNIAYIGGDIVGEMINDLNQRYASRSREFRRIDLITDPLPAVDAVMVRDLLLHLPNALGVKVLGNITRSGAKWALISNYPATASNEDVSLGGHRFPNLTLPPFNWPEPVRVIDEATPSEGRPDKQLGLWKLG